MKIWSLIGLLSGVAASSLVRQDSSATSRDRLIVDVGYAKYRGVHDTNTTLNTWKSVRYAAPPIDKLRWQAPQPPPKSRDIVDASKQPDACPQSGATGTPPVYGFNSGPGNEDCLYLNIYAPPDAQNLPVLVWIHGGGYGLFGATYDPSGWINVNDKGFIFVEIQYRLGAFGFLASKDVKNKGQLNAGLLDMRFALEWVQQHISRFGGDPEKVTLGGESAGAGAAMFQSLAYGGKECHLFSNIFVASPYTPAVWNYDDRAPTEKYNAFVKLAGCEKAKNKFDCLVDADSKTLQEASGKVSDSTCTFGSFAFQPVVDGTFLEQRPAEQLSRGRVSAQRILIGSNADEGVPLTDPDVTTRNGYDEFVASSYPLFTRKTKAWLDRVYRIHHSAPGDDAARFETTGEGGSSPNALTTSGYATGIQQTVFDISAEATYICPGYWLADAFTRRNREAWKYQYSVTPSYHGADLGAYFFGLDNFPGPDLQSAFAKMAGNFVINNTPVIAARDAAAGKANATVPTEGKDLLWPKWSLDRPQHLILNTTGGSLEFANVTNDLQYYIRSGPGQVNVFSLADADTWEAGRGARCDFWMDIAKRVPV